LIDFILKYGPKLELDDLDLFKKIIINKKLESRKLRYEKFEISFKRFQDENEFDYYDSGESLVFIYGRVFPRFNSKFSDKAKITAEDISSITSNEIIYKEFKGNFLIIKFHKRISKLEILTDQLGLLPIYYGIAKETLIVSSNLSLMKKFFSNINERVILEKLLFNYPITDETFFDGVKFLTGRKILSFNKSHNLKIIDLFSLENFIFNDRYRDFDQDEFIEIFNDSVLKRYNSISGIPYVSLTGGFDGRSIVSTLLKYNLDFKSYSFGKFGGENTQVPLSIAKKINIDYKPIYLEDDYLEKYSRFALSTVLASDGLSDFERANYQFAFNCLDDDTANAILTGLVGGEIFAPIKIGEGNDAVSWNYYNLILNNNYVQKDQKIQLSNKIENYLDIDTSLFLKEINEIIHLRREKLNKYYNEPFNYLKYFYDLIKFGFPRFYGAEIHTTRFLKSNLPPMYDLDILKYLLETKHKKNYKLAFQNENPILRLNNRKLQALIINKNYPPLARIPVDRSFSPHDLLHKYKLPIVAFKYLSRRKKVNNSPKEFTSDIWSNELYKDLLAGNFKTSDLVNYNLLKKNYLNNYSSARYSKNINKIISLDLFLNY